VLGVIYDRVLPGAAWLVQRRKVLEACSMKATFRTHVSMVTELQALCEWMDTGTLLSYLGSAV
jgi:hypothetical protein